MSDLKVMIGDYSYSIGKVAGARGDSVPFERLMLPTQSVPPRQAADISTRMISHDYNEEKVKKSAYQLTQSSIDANADYRRNYIDGLVEFLSARNADTTNVEQVFSTNEGIRGYASGVNLAEPPIELRNLFSRSRLTGEFANPATGRTEAGYMLGVTVHFLRERGKLLTQVEVGLIVSAYHSFIRSYRREDTLPKATEIRDVSGNNPNNTYENITSHGFALQRGRTPDNTSFDPENRKKHIALGNYPKYSEGGRGEILGHSSVFLVDRSRDPLPDYWEESWSLYGGYNILTNKQYVHQKTDKLKIFDLDQSPTDVPRINLSMLDIMEIQAGAATKLGERLRDIKK
jgi:hypothetical protein